MMNDPKGTYTNLTLVDYHRDREEDVGEGMRLRLTIKMSKEGQKGRRGKTE